MSDTENRPETAAANEEPAPCQAQGSDDTASTSFLKGELDTTKIEKRASSGGSCAPAKKRKTTKAKRCGSNSSKTRRASRKAPKRKRSRSSKAKRCSSSSSKTRRASRKAPKRKRSRSSKAKRCRSSSSKTRPASRKAPKRKRSRSSKAKRCSSSSSKTRRASRKAPKRKRSRSTKVKRCPSTYSRKGKRGGRGPCPRPGSARNRSVPVCPSQSPGPSTARRHFRTPVGAENRRRPPGPFVMYYLDLLKQETRSAGRKGPRPRIVAVIKRASGCWKKLGPEMKRKYTNRYCTEFKRIKNRDRGNTKGGGC